MEKGLVIVESEYDVTVGKNRDITLVLTLATGFSNISIPIKLRDGHVDEEILINRFDMIDMKSILDNIKMLKLRVFNDPKVMSVKIVNGLPRITSYDGQDCYTALPGEILNRNISLEEFKRSEFNTIWLADGQKYYTLVFDEFDDPKPARRAFVDTENFIYEVTGKEEEELLKDVFKDNPYCAISGRTLKVVEYKTVFTINCDCDHFDEHGKSTLIKKSHGAIQCTQCNGYVRNRLKMAYHKD